MNHGVIEQIGTPTEIYRQPKSLFVADFIGETNQLHATLAAACRFTLGNASLAGTTYGLAPGQPIVVTIRPEDIIPQAPVTAAAVSGGSSVEVISGEMEFLGSFWRSRLSGTALGDEQLVADFSINAVRRLSLDEGEPLTIELPASRLIAFPAQNAPGDGARAG